MRRWIFAGLAVAMGSMAARAVAKPTVETPASVERPPATPGETAAAKSEPLAPPNAPSLPPQPSGKVVSDTRAGMGTRMQILVYTSDETGARAAIAECFAELTRLEQVLSEWIPTSEISQINSYAGDRAIKVGADTLAVVTAGKQAAELTSGGFAMTWLALGGLWKIPPVEGEAAKVPSKTDVERVLHLVGDSAIAVDATASTIRLPRGGMAIGVGAIGKGYAMDRIADLLATRGFKNVLVSAGGDVVARGTKGPKPWVVGIQDPRGPGYFAVMNLFDQAISTAGDYERYFEVGGVRYHHILDPRTGFPARGVRSVTVIADKGLLTDALDTGIFVMGREAGMKLIEDDPRLEGIIIDDQNQLTMSSGLGNALRILRQPTQ